MPKVNQSTILAERIGKLEMRVEQLERLTAQTKDIEMMLVNLGKRLDSFRGRFQVLIERLGFAGDV